MPEYPPFPRKDLHEALAEGHPGRETIDQLHHELSTERPDRSAIESHVRKLRSIPELAAIVANWWDDPATQRFIANLSATGL
jgi:hypothetical protein